jgi:hypothetical protein
MELQRIENGNSEINQMGYDNFQEPVKIAKHIVVYNFEGCNAVQSTLLSFISFYYNLRLKKKVKWKLTTNLICNNLKITERIYKYNKNILINRGLITNIRKYKYCEMELTPAAVLLKSTRYNMCPVLEHNDTKNNLNCRKNLLLGVIENLSNRTGQAYIAPKIRKMYNLSRYTYDKYMKDMEKSNLILSTQEHSYGYDGEFKSWHYAYIPQFDRANTTKTESMDDFKNSIKDSTNEYISVVKSMDKLDSNVEYWWKHTRNSKTIDNFAFYLKSRVLKNALNKQDKPRPTYDSKDAQQLFKSKEMQELYKKASGIVPNSDFYGE